MNPKIQNSMKRIGLRFMIIAINFNPAMTMAGQKNETEIKEPQTADKIVANIRAIVDHGDLADEQFYAQNLGIVMEGSAIGPMAEPDFPCGLGMTSKREQLIEQRFYYKNIPWYFTSWFGRNRVCDRPYVKAFLPNGLIEVAGSLMVDTKKICITEDDLRKNFRSGKYSLERGGFMFNYSATSQNTINIQIYSPSSTPKCAVYFNFYQNKPN